MQIKIIAVGNKMPNWVSDGYGEYAKRLPKDFSLQLIEVALGKRGKNADIQRAIKTESDKIISFIDASDQVIALDVKGKNWSTEQLARKASDWRMGGQNLSLLIGGPDGLSAECLDLAQQRWSLSALTLPHPVVRIVLAEQLYRAWTILQNHPYHR